MKAEQLRKSILQYAIQGKLVPQIDTEEPASELLKKIKAEKQELIKLGKIKKEKPLPPITDEEKPFEIPDSWEWVRFSDIANLFTGNSINAQEKKSKYTNLLNGYNYIATKDVLFNSTIDYNNGIKIPFETTFKIASQKSSLLCIEGGSAGRKVAILNQDVCFGNKLCCFEPYIVDHNYLFYYLQSPIFTENFTSSKSGMIGGVGVNTLKTLLFILPPLVEQQRIVARIEELMAFVDEYEKKEIELSKLEKEFPEKLKKSILQYAIQGKLVPQIDIEEPANELLKKIKAEKQELIKQGKIKKEKPLSPITDEEKPFEIPESWEWVRLDDVFQITPRNNISDELEVSFIPMTYISDKYNNSFNFDIRIWKDVKKGFTHLKNNDVIIAKITPCYQNLKSVVLKDLINGYGAGTTELHVLRQNKLFISTEYLLWFVKSPFFILSGEAVMTGTAGQQRVGTNYIKNCGFPLPPLAEQQRIVARIEELFALVDMLAEGKKLPKSNPATENKDNIILFDAEEKEERKHKVDVSSFVMAARDSDTVKPETMDKVLQQVQAYYDKNN